MKKIVKYNIKPKWAERQAVAMIKNSIVVDIGQDEKGVPSIWASHREIDEDEQVERKFFLHQDGKPLEPETTPLGGFMFLPDFNDPANRVHMNLFEDISEQ